MSTQKVQSFQVNEIHSPGIIIIHQQQLTSLITPYNLVQLNIWCLSLRWKFPFTQIMQWRFCKLHHTNFSFLTFGSSCMVIIIWQVANPNPTCSEMTDPFFWPVEFSTGIVFSQVTDFYFANYKFLFCKSLAVFYFANHQQVSISQIINRFLFHKLQISTLGITDVNENCFLIP